MDWPIKRINDWTTFMGVAGLFHELRPHEFAYAFRGQANEEWDLRPTLLRLLPEGVSVPQALKIERFSLEEFRAQAHLHFPEATLPTSIPKAPLPEWWALMQHHHAPTRLLDWTHSPYVALYYAVEQRLECDGAIYVVRHLERAQDSSRDSRPVMACVMNSLQMPIHPISYYSGLQRRKAIGLSHNKDASA